MNSLSFIHFPHLKTPSRNIKRNIERDESVHPALQCPPWNAPKKISFGGKPPGSPAEKSPLEILFWELIESGPPGPMYPQMIEAESRTTFKKLRLETTDEGHTIQIQPPFEPYPIECYFFDQTGKPLRAERLVANRFTYAEERGRRLNPKDEKAFPLALPTEAQLADWIKQFKTGSIRQIK
ncbi:MAG: hypothetical protein K2X66_09605 [Cyanobacteria bacterium]|nr:hypothetical protein [Cyanobacteriota bacterium]